MLPLLLLFAGHLLLISRDIKNVTAHSGTLWYNPDRHCFVPLRLSFSGTVAIFFSPPVSLAMAIFNHTHTYTYTHIHWTGTGFWGASVLRPNPKKDSAHTSDSRFFFFANIFTSAIREKASL